MSDVFTGFLKAVCQLNTQCVLCLLVFYCNYTPLRGRTLSTKTQLRLIRGHRYDANGFTAGAVRVEGAAMCTGGLLTEWRGVERLDDVTEDSLALLFAVKPAPGVCFAAGSPTWVSRSAMGCMQ